MIQLLLENAGALLGGLVTLALFVLNILSLARGRRIFRCPRSCCLKYL